MADRRRFSEASPVIRLMLALSPGPRSANVTMSFCKCEPFESTCVTRIPLIFKSP